LCDCGGGDDELAVAELRMVAVRGDSGQQPARKVQQPQLVLLRSGEWSTRRPPPVGRAVPSCWWADKVVPVDGGLLCWMDLISGVVFSDVFADKPGLRYVPLPTDYSFGRETHRDVGGGGALKLVDIFPRCYCGDRGGTYCRRSREAYTIGPSTPGR
jgi:hypothetical protein